MPELITFAFVLPFWYSVKRSIKNAGLPASAAAVVVAAAASFSARAQKAIQTILKLNACGADLLSLRLVSSVYYHSWFGPRLFRSVFFQRSSGF